MSFLCKHEVGDDDGPIPNVGSGKVEFFAEFDYTLSNQVRIGTFILSTSEFDQNRNIRETIFIASNVA